MGYRVRLSRFPKVDRKRYMHLKSEVEAYEWFEQHDTEHAHYRPRELQELVELGKYVDYKKQGLDVEKFYEFDLEENDFIIVNREFLLHIIEEYRKNTVGWYTKLLDEVARGDVAQVSFHLKNKISEWDNKYYSTLKTEEHDTGKHEDGRLTRSWKFEYAVFNLLFILHTFDWDNDYLIYSGW